MKIICKTPNNNLNEIYYASVEHLDDDSANYDLPQIRKERAEKLKFSKDKKLSVGAYLLLRCALSSHNIDISKYEFCYSDKGKPYLKNCPFHFSLSHSGQYVLVGISNNPIGVDIQEIKQVKENITSLVFNVIDQRIYDLSDNKLDTFYKIWTFKEAIVKKSGEGLVAIKNKKIDYSNNYSDSFLYSFDIIPGYKIGVATTTENINLLREVTLK